MLAELILKAETKAGDKSALARKLHEQRPRITKYANLTRKPTDTSILKLADYLGLDKGETLYKAKLELEPGKRPFVGVFKLACLAGIEPTTLSFGG